MTKLFLYVLGIVFSCTLCIILSNHVSNVLSNMEIEGCNEMDNKYKNIVESYRGSYQVFRIKRFL